MQQICMGLFLCAPGSVKSLLPLIQRIVPVNYFSRTVKISDDILSNKIRNATFN